MGSMIILAMVYKLLRQRFVIHSVLPLTVRTLLILQIGLTIESAKLHTMERLQRLLAAVCIIIVIIPLQATDFMLNYPSGIAVDLWNNIYIADSGSRMIFKVDAATGTIGLVAGGGTSEDCNYTGPATNALLSGPWSIALDNYDNIYIADYGCGCVRKVDEHETISTVAGGGTPPDGRGDGGSATAAALYGPTGLAFDSDGNMYIADWDDKRVRKVDALTQSITTIAGGGTPDDGLGDNGTAAAAMLNNPSSVAVDNTNNIYIGDVGNQRILKVDAITKKINTVAGGGLVSDINYNGPALAPFFFPDSVALDSQGGILIADSGNSVIWRMYHGCIDNDGDGYGVGSECFAVDCNDNDASGHPGAPEICYNGLDDNCNGEFSEGCATWYRDADGDGYGNAAETMAAISQPEGHVADSTDCDDTSASVYPVATELCNGIDDDCNGQIDETCACVDNDGVYAMAVTAGWPRL